MADILNYNDVRISELDSYLFGQGTHYEIYNKMGAHVAQKDGKTGVYFAVWAPAAKDVYVIGEFNDWKAYGYDMKKISDGGIYELFVEGAMKGQMYKYLIIAQNGEAIYKADPYANAAQLRPETASIVADLNSFTWTDSAWVESKKKENHLKSPMSIYECHLGSWKKQEDGTEDGYINYRDIAPDLAAYVSEMGYTHIELMGIAEYPFDGSWGYQVTGYYAPTARYGTPEDFMYFVNYMHSKHIAIILDWVPAHFPKDAHGLANFDGSCVYEYADPRKGEHPDWGTKVFDYGKNEVSNFLIANGMFWVDKFHIDGLRVDAVASMLYLDYGRTEGNWVPNKYGGNENLEAIAFLKRLNELTHEQYPGIAMIAEESTSWPGVSKPSYLGGLGFTFKWNMGWMHDTLEYMELDPVYRSYNHGKLTFSLLYAFSENFVLPLSHDEVVHGKRSLLNKMPGDYQQKFANLRALYAYMAMHPGKKLLFMGGEFAQWIEWNSNAPLDWNLLDYPQHKAMQAMVRDLNRFYRGNPALWSDDFTPNGFQWLDGGDYRQSVVSFIRWDREHKEPVVIILNLTPVVRDSYTTGIPLPGEWEEVFNTDRSEYGGTNLLNSSPMRTQDGLYHGQPWHITLRLPWLGAVILKHKKS